MRRQGTRKGHHAKASAKKPLALVTAVVAAVAIAVSGFTLAKAAINDPNNLVNTVSPSGTTINVFDYWRGSYDGGRNGDDTDNPEKDFNQWSNAGINQDHTLKFGNNMKAEIPSGEEQDWADANRGGDYPVSNIVAGELDEDGYPVLSGEGVVNGSTEPLAYLFDQSNDPNSKQSYANVQGLLKVDDEGYYVYDAKQNFAQFNEDTNSFTVYNAWGVTNANESYTDRDGQFFLFNDASDILTDKGGTLHDNGEVKSNSNDLNHYFGLSMSTQFVQQHGGHTDESGATPVTYNFSGDDDVWVYIDGYLVGDLGGIHSACALDIDFSTGAVTVFKDKDLNNDYNDGDELISRTTLRAMMATAAGSDESIAPLFEGDSSVLKDGTYHTLDFFYMERGNSDSNMSLKFNLQSIPETDIMKVDQDGTRVQGATFSVTDTVSGAQICAATTEADGSVILMQPETHTLITPDWLVDNSHCNITLTETTVPAGYRATKPIKLSVETLKATDGARLNVLLSSNQWESGAYAQPKVTATTPHDIKLAGHSGITVENLRSGTGTLFAVVQQKDSDGQWHTVTGNALDGWHVTDQTGEDGALAADAASKYEFEIGTSGNFQTEIENLPGDIQDYVYFAGDSGTFRGAYYYTTADSVADATADNTYEVTNTTDFDRQFAARLYVSDIVNRVVVQKTDENGIPLNGAELALFDESQVTENDGTYTLNENAQQIPGQSGTTRTLTESADKIALDGAVVFTGLKPGNYYVGEVSAPKGYAKTNVAAKVTVTDAGVYADAGAANDGVTVTRGVGRVLRSMVQFATADDIDASLHNIVATPQTRDPETGSWTDVKGAQPIHLTYDDDGDSSALDYTVTPDSDSEQRFTVDTGTPNLRVEQCDKHQSSPSENIDGDITGLFTGVTIVNLENEPDSNPATLAGSESFKGTKILDGRDPLQGETFGFDLTKGEATNGGDWSKVTYTPTDGVTAAFETATATATMNGAPSASFWFDGTFSFDQAGTYVFNVNETQHNGDALPADGTNGMTYDRHTGTITVTVTEDGTGTLHATAVAGTDGASTTFTNKYEPTSATYGGDGVLFGGTKTVEDATGNSFVMADKQFTFMLRAQAQGNPMPEGYDGTTVDEDGRPVMSVTNKNTNTTNNTATYDFGTITFDKDDMAGAQPVEGQSGQLSKTFQYNVYELEAGNGAMPAGVSAKDPGRTYTVTFTVVEDQSKGTITVSNVDVKLHNGADSVEMGKLDFTNVYNADETTGATTIFKTLDGRNWQRGDAFTFDVSMTANGITTDQLPDFNFDSVNGTVSGYTESDGQLSYNITIKPESVTGNTFQFNTGTATYKHEGTYVYTITEREVDAEQVPSVTKDDQVYTVKVTIDDQDGTLHRDVVITPSTASGRVDFTNTYTTTGKLDANGAEAIKVTKNFTGRPNDEWLDTDSFKAMLTAEEGIVDGQTTAAENVPMPDGCTGGAATVDLTKDSHENVAFGDITYTRPGTYNYTLTEVQENSIDGVYYSLAEYDVVVTAEDNGDGTMTVTSEIKQAKDSDGIPLAPTQDVDVATFDNVYQPNFATLSGAQNLTVTKNLEGRAWFNTDEWIFTLALTDGDASKVIMPAQTQLTITGDTEGHTASFGDITFRAAGIYTFTVTESGVEPGVTNDADAERTIVVNVADDAKGNLIATVNAGLSEGLTFTNTYQPTGTTISGDSAITVQKTLTGRDWADGEEFGFTIKNIQKPEGLESAPMPENDTITVGKPAEGNVATAQFGDMTFTQAGTYVYQIKENDGDGSLSYDGHAATVTVAVFENQADGTLSAQVSYDNSTATTDGDKAVTGAAAFTNAYNTEGFDLSFSGTKHLEGRDFQPGDEFTFMVNAGADVPVPDGVTVTSRDESSWTGTVTIKPESGNDATIDFGKAAITQAGEYTYLITEQNTGIDGMGYDESTHTITFKAEDNGQGGFNVTQTAGDLTWVNNAAFKMDKPVSLEGTKSMTGADMSNGQFTFTVEPQDGAPMGEGAQAVTNGEPTQNEDGSWTASLDVLKDVSYDAPGDYVYLVTEQNDGQPGFTYDGTQYKVTVTVAQDGTSSTKVEKSTDGENWAEATAVAFNNSYATEGSATLNGSANLGGTKTLSGRDWTNDDSFTFILAAGDQPTQQAIADGTIHMPDTMEVVQGAYSDGAQVPFNFGNIVFDQAGTYTFTISEQQPGDDGFVGPTDGMTYDDHVYIITVEVADNGSGGLGATVTKADGDTNWTNTYQAGSGILPGAENLEVTKVIDGRDWQTDDSFTFVLTADEANPEGAALPENASGITITSETPDHKAAFGDITFTKAGNYTFYVNEQVPADEDKLGGMTYDDAQRLIEVSVVDNGDGTLTPTATVTSEHGMTFTNTYEPGGTTTLPEEGSFALRKVLTGKAWNGDEFTFKIEAADSASANYLPEQTEVTVSQKTGTNEDGNDYADFTFGPITYDQIGTYTYTVTEVTGDNAGMDYDTHVATVTVTVSDDLNGGLTASASVAGATFTNVYESSLQYGANGEGGLWIRKSLTNHDIADGQFEFTVTAADEASAQKAGFDGMTKVVVSAPATVTATEDGTQVATSMAEIFSDATFTQDDVDDTYTYTVQETKGGEAGYTNDDTVYTVTITTADDGQGGLTVTTTVTDGADYTQSYVYDNDEMTDDPQAVVPFDNQYQAEGMLGGDGSVSINATKSLTNRPMSDGEFTFNVIDANGNTVATGTNDANGAIVFDAISYTKDVLLADAANGNATWSVVDGKDTFTYQYTVAEDTSALPEGVTPIAASFQIIVTVTDNNDGTLSIAVTYPDGGDSLQFRNAYGAGEGGSATININGIKALHVHSGNNAPNITGKYTFTLTGSEGAPMPERTTATNDAAGNVNFGDITFTMENVFGDTGSQGTGSTVRTKTFTYTVTESGSVPGVANDPVVTKTFTVTVIDNGDGTLSVAVDPATCVEFGFVNTYGVTPVPETPTGDDGATGSGHFTVTKTLSGRDMVEGEFSFALIDAWGNVVSQGTNDASGNVELSAITFGRPGVYTYALVEINTGQGGVVFDRAVYWVTAHVADNGDGTLSVVWSVRNAMGQPVDSVTFSNAYSAAPATAVFSGSKVLDGRELEAGEFTFELRDPDTGEVLQTVTNAADGTFTFDAQVFGAPGEYTFEIVEVKGDAEGVTYDETVYTVKVTVVDDGEGHLMVTEITYNGAAGLPVFTNTYEEPATPEPGPGPEPTPEPEPGPGPQGPEPSEPAGPAGPAPSPEIPDTGDVTNGALPVALAVGGVALVAGGAAFVLRRRNG